MRHQKSYLLLSSLGLMLYFLLTLESSSFSNPSSGWTGGDMTLSMQTMSLSLILNITTVHYHICLFFFVRNCLYITCVSASLISLSYISTGIRTILFTNCMHFQYHMHHTVLQIRCYTINLQIQYVSKSSFLLKLSYNVPANLSWT